jgi:hypothetical protein
VVDVSDRTARQDIPIGSDTMSVSPLNEMINRLSTSRTWPTSDQRRRGTGFAVLDGPCEMRKTTDMAI